MGRLKTTATRALWTLGLAATLATSAPDTRRTASTEPRPLRSGQVVHVSIRPNQAAADVADAYVVHVFAELVLPGFRLKVVPDDRELEPVILELEEDEADSQATARSQSQSYTFSLPVSPDPCAGPAPCEFGYSLELEFDGEEGAELPLQVDAAALRNDEAGCMQMNPPPFAGDAALTVSFDD